MGSVHHIMRAPKLALMYNTFVYVAQRQSRRGSHADADVKLSRLSPDTAPAGLPRSKPECATWRKRSHTSNPDNQGEVKMKLRADKLTRSKKKFNAHGWKNSIRRSSSFKFLCITSIRPHPLVQFFSKTSVRRNEPLSTRPPWLACAYDTRSQERKQGRN